MSDPAGWYSDPTTRHELRYWDGYAWLDNVSDSGATATDPLGGKPMPPPSEAASKAQQGPSPTASKSKTPIYIGAGVAVVVILIAALLLTRKSDNGNATAKATTLAKDPITLSEKGSDPNHPTVFPVHIDSNTAVIVDVTATDKNVTPGIIIEAKQGVVDQLNAKISGLSDLLSDKLKAACPNLREEDLGAKGDIAYSFSGSGEAGKDLHDFTVVPIAGDFEFIPVVVDDKGACKAGELTLTLTPHFLDMSGATSSDELQTVVNDSPDLKEFTSS
jgi:hypothetical protein